MINLTDPKPAHLVARYREWVAEENRRISKKREEVASDVDGDYRRRVAEYDALPFSKKLFAIEPKNSSLSEMVPCGPLAFMTPTHQGFLDWCIREGIEVPQEDKS